MDTWQPRNFVEPSQAVVDADLTLAVRSQAHGQQHVRSHLLFPRNASHFRGPQRSSLDACEPAQLPLSLSPGLLLQCSPKFVLLVSILNIPRYRQWYHIMVPYPMKCISRFLDNARAEL